MLHFAGPYLRAWHTASCRGRGISTADCSLDGCASAHPGLLACESLGRPVDTQLGDKVGPRKSRGPCLCQPWTFSCFGMPALPPSPGVWLVLSLPPPGPRAPGFRQDLCSVIPAGACPILGAVGPHRALLASSAVWTPVCGLHAQPSLLTPASSAV